MTNVQTTKMGDDSTIIDEVSQLQKSRVGISISISFLALDLINTITIARDTGFV